MSDATMLGERLVEMVRAPAPPGAGRAVRPGVAARRLPAGADLAVVPKWFVDGPEFAVWAIHQPPRFDGRFGGDCGLGRELPGGWGDPEPVAASYSGRLVECRRCGSVLVDRYAPSNVRPYPDADEGVIFDLEAALLAL